MKRGSPVIILAATVLSLAASAQAKDLNLAPQERLITILATNDIHGEMQPRRGRDGVPVGGMDVWGGIVNSMRQGLQQRFGAQAGMALVDAGDQFQGTLMSNFAEGAPVIAAMNVIGYDAALPGNHDFDFGPQGWLEDKVTPQSQDKDPRGAFNKLVKMARFPFISANTFLKSSFRDTSGRPIRVSGKGCVPEGGASISWKNVRRPMFARPYLIKQIAGARVAFIGIDDSETPQTTTPENVSDLCYMDEGVAYLQMRSLLNGRADAFVLVAHKGNAKADNDATELTKFILSKGGPDSVHAVIASHTHFTNYEWINGVPVIQSGSNGQMFGRIDLIWDSETRRVNIPATRAYSGVPISPNRCGDFARDFCVVGQGGAAYEGVPVSIDQRISQIIATAVRQVAPLAQRPIGTAAGVIARDRINESPLADALTDAFRMAARAQIAFLNTGGIRENLPAGPLNYQHLFSVFPFNNRGVVIAAMPVERLFKILQRSIESCGSYGALMQSGLRVVFQRNCAGNSSVDQNARLLHVETVDGEVLLDAASNFTAPANRTFSVVTLDFLAAGGSGYNDFAGLPVTADLGVVRDVLANQFFAQPARLNPSIDGRWQAR